MKSCRLGDSKLPSSIHPVPPVSVVAIADAHLLALVFDNSQILDLSPVRTPSYPTSLAHQADDSLLFCPPLLDGYVWQIRGSIAFAVMREGQAYAMDAKLPIIGMRGWRKVCKQGDGGGEGREL